MKSWLGIAFLALLAVAGLRSAAIAGAGEGAYYLGLAIAGTAILLIFVMIGQRGRAMPDRFLPDTDVEQPGSLVAMLAGFAVLAAVGAVLALSAEDRDLHLAGLLLIISAVVAAARAIGRFFDRWKAGHGS
ncbi:MAG TPA: hypothetical protein VF274_02435 [Alphaproteobacteria bacterium]|jgi:hypothetical protein